MTSLPSRVLSLSAAPTFAVLAVFSCRLPSVLCGPSQFNEMALMYALMSVFHVSPWFELQSITRSWLSAAVYGVFVNACIWSVVLLLVLLSKKLGLG